MVKRGENDSGLNLCRAFKARPSMNRVKSCVMTTVSDGEKKIKIDDDR